MRAAIYNPYLDSLGGGERYTMAFASVLKKYGYEVFVEWKNQGIRKELENRFGIKLGDIEFVADIKRGDGYDLCFWVSDGSVPLLRARKNFLHFQVPFTKVNGNSLINRMKFFRIKKVVCNSGFTKKFIDREYGVESVVLYPPIDIKQIKPRRKENVVLYVGRFSGLLQSKRQDILIDVFKKFYKKTDGSWKLVLAGGTEVGSDKFLLQLKKNAKGFPVEFIESPSFKTLILYYEKAKIYWSAAGYGIDEDTEPQKAEHFGITVVEAMAAGTVPVVFNAGGYKEIIAASEDGFLWNNKHELLKTTLKLAGDNSSIKKIASKAKTKSRDFSYEKFEEEVTKII